MYRNRSVPPRYLSAIDAIAWFIALPLALSLRLIDHEFAWDGYSILFLVALGSGLIQIAVGYQIGLYTGRYRFGTFDELKGLVRAISITSMFPILLILFSGEIAPRTIGFIGTALVFTIVFFVRFTLRVRYEKIQRKLPGVATIIYGAGEVGAHLAQQMLRDRDSSYRPVGFIDDDDSKQRLEISGLKVLGKIENLETLVNMYDLKQVIVAISNVDSPFLGSLEETCRKSNLQAVIAPSASQLLMGQVKLSDLTEISDEDLIGRKAIEVDEVAISSFIRGKRVLITGAGGSIGSEIARQVHRYEPEQVFMLDRDETLLHDLQLTLDGRGLMTDRNIVLADIREAGRIREVFEECRPEVVFHAAALKHLAILELYPEEAKKTNVNGTRNIIEACSEFGVKAFVNISTDKAVQATSVLGRTKREAEHLTSEAAKRAATDTRFLSVRFGNVIGSRGSVLDTFRYQIERGGPLTITDPQAKRYFMTVSEAVHLVLEASALGKNDEVLILDMGLPIQIMEIARKLIEKSGKQIEIVYTGLRPGEKLDELLVEGSTERLISRNFQVLAVK